MALGFYVLVSCLPKQKILMLAMSSRNYFCTDRIDDVAKDAAFSADPKLLRTTLASNALFRLVVPATGLFTIRGMATKPNEAILTEFLAPGIADLPILNTQLAVLAIAHKDDCMVHYWALSAVIKYASHVRTPVACVNCDCERANRDKALQNLLWFVLFETHKALNFYQGT